MNNQPTARQKKLLSDLDRLIEYCKNGASVRSVALPVGKYRLFKQIARKAKRFAWPDQIDEEHYRGFEVRMDEASVKTSVVMQQLSLK